MDLVKTSKRMSKILRHDPHPLTMDSKGWVKTEDLLKHLQLTQQQLDTIVETNDKKRFMFNEDKTFIRASQGHSQGVATEKEHAQLTTVQQDFILYHGTDDATWDLIKDDKIIPGSRQYVHWTPNRELAEKRAYQRKFHNKTKPVLITLSVKHYLNLKGKLFIAENEVYLTPEIEGKDLKVIFI